MIDYNEVETFVRRRLADLASLNLFAVMAAGGDGFWATGKKTRMKTGNGTSIWAGDRLVGVTTSQPLAEFIAQLNPEAVNAIVTSCTALLNEAVDFMKWDGAPRPGRAISLSGISAPRVLLGLAAMFASHDDYKKEWNVG